VLSSGVSRYGAAELGPYQTGNGGGRDAGPGTFDLKGCHFRDRCVSWVDAGWSDDARSSGR
jgi:hypothetical protein